MLRRLIPYAGHRFLICMVVLLTIVIAVRSRREEVASTPNITLINSVETGQKFNAIAFSPDRQIMASGTMVDSATSVKPYEISLWDVKNGSHLRAWRTDDALDLSFSPDGKTLASRGTKGAFLWRVEDGALLHTLTVNDEQVLRIVFSPNGQTLIGAGVFKLWLWSVRDGSLLHISDINKCGETNSLAVSPDGKTLAVGCGEYNHAETPDNSYYPILLLQGNNGSLEKTLKGHATEVSCLTFSPDGHLLTSGGGRSDGELRLWQISDGSLLDVERVGVSLRKELGGQYPAIFTVAFSPNGQMLAYSGSDYKIYLLRVKDRKLITSLKENEDAILKIAFNNDRTLISANEKGTIQMWEIADSISR
jgi:WD40 repeat protein